MNNFESRKKVILRKNVKVKDDTIILYDKNDSSSGVLKKVEIVTPDGNIRNYEIRRTSKGNYLFNWSLTRINNNIFKASQSQASKL